MSAVFAEIDISSLTKARPVTDEILVGKDILELLAGAMYADPLTIFREYVQNAADSIDVARDAGLEGDEELGVVITLDRTLRSIRIRDTGASIPEREFVRRLTTIGASGKRGLGLRGFRGVGRLSGLGYCQELLFRGRVDGETKVTELLWDGRKLRGLLRDAGYNDDLASLVRSVVEVRRVPGEGFPARFFEVELRKVTRLRGDLLLNDDSIRSFLSQVAPVPFHPEFAHGGRITEFLRQKGVREPVDVRLAGDTAPIYHRARDCIEFTDKVKDSIQSVEFLEFLGQDGEVDAYGWLLDHAYLGAVPRRLGFGGIRLRSGNIQVGSDALLAPLFVEPRFAGWVIGDIHVVSPRIIPNARRDEFEAGVHYAHLQDELSIVLKRLTHVIRERSISRNRVRKVQQHLGLVDMWLEQAREEDLPSAVAARVRAIVEAHIADAQKHLDKLLPDAQEATTLKQRITTALGRRTKLLRTDEPGTPGRRSAKDKAIDIAIGVILDHASTPLAGLTMSKQVLKAFEASSPA
jgi:hypothetical protein